MVQPPQPRTSAKVPLEEILVQGDAFFRGESPMHFTASKLAKKLRELGIPFAVTGGMALSPHNYRRYTDDVDVIVRPEDWKRFKERWLGLGYVEVFKGSKAVRDTEHDVKIDVLLTGGFPGDGKPKEFAFPDPARPGVVSDLPGVPIVTLETLIELKIASGKTALGRQRKDYADVIELIRHNRLQESFARGLDAYVSQEFLALLNESRLLNEHPGDSLPE
jgi:hypothetical protein